MRVATFGTRSSHAAPTSATVTWAPWKAAVIVASSSSGVQQVIRCPNVWSSRWANGCCRAGDLDGRPREQPTELGLVVAAGARVVEQRGELRVPPPELGHRVALSGHSARRWCR